MILAKMPNKAFNLVRAPSLVAIGLHLAEQFRRVLHFY